MATRNILDYQGNIVGELTLPDGTSEQIWTEKLAPYAVNPNANAQSSYINFTIKHRKEYAEALLERFKARNLGLGINAMQGMWLHHRMRALSFTFYGLPVTIDVLNLAISGDIEIACLSLMNGEVDDGSQPYHFFTAETRDYLVNDMKAYLGWT